MCTGSAASTPEVAQPPAEVYTHGHAPVVVAAHAARTASTSAAYLLPHLQPGLDVLDIGCGPGSITADLAAYVTPGGSVRGVDREPAVVATAAAVYTDVPGLSFATGDAYAIDLPDDAVDVVHAHQVLQHLTDPVRALREMRRVCRPGGVVAARDADYSAMTWWPPEPGLTAWLRTYRAVAHANGAEPDAGRRLLGWALAAGFTEVQPSASTWCYATPDARRWWSGLWSQRVTETAIATQAVSGGHATPAALEEMAAGWREWGAAPEGWFAVLHGEVLARA